MIDLDDLYDNRSDPDVRMVLEDYQLTRGEKVTRLGMAIWAAAAAAAADAAADDADARSQINNTLYGDIDVKNGLKIVQISSPRGYGYAITLIGWLRRVSGDEWILCAGARMLSRSSGDRILTQVAVDGPKKDYKCWPASKALKELHRLLIRRSLPATEEAWVEHCPQPKDWSEP